MAHATTASNLQFSPEEGIHQIQLERTRKSVIAASVAVIAAIVTIAAVYFSYRGVPAPADPANVHPALVEPYH
ncbi:MAG TPA: hypothetical protein VGM44_00135 [Polyangiaceae bacterium]|jgi:hypothetical protein